MKIKIKNTYLARGIQHKESPRDLNIIGKRNIQEASFLGGMEIKTFDRGNLSNRVSFKITRQHDSLEEAIRHTLLHSSKIEGLNGTVEFIAEENDKETSFELMNASVRYVESKVTATATHHRYEIIGGKFKD